jgi:hypothetical protein
MTNWAQPDPFHHLLTGAETEREDLSPSCHGAIAGAESLSLVYNKRCVDRAAQEVASSKLPQTVSCS